MPAADSDDDDVVCLPSAWQETLDGDEGEDGSEGGFDDDAGADAGADDGANDDAEAAEADAVAASSAGVGGAAPAAAAEVALVQGEWLVAAAGSVNIPPPAATAPASISAAVDDSWIDEPLAEGEVIEVEVEDEEGAVGWHPAEVIEVLEAARGQPERFVAMVDGDEEFVEE